MASSEIADLPPPDRAPRVSSSAALMQEGALSERELVPDAAIGNDLARGSVHRVRQRRVGAAEAGAVLAIVAVALVVRLGPLQRGLGFDELFTAIHFVQTDTLWQTATTWLNLNNHVAFSLLGRLSVGLFGMSEWALRLPALAIGLISLVVLWWLARPIVGPGAA